ncbi:DHHC-type zinc finger family protein [Actinidia rufa]|uniref:DHHC-type zinc finger family protein n=1 Tax=Actinidia rufa TaxID=165716 RepID=A0A7J0DX27_9ERIC|nr:DHHC-type zinc finger family protein [Actinidia rufa]
MGKAVEDIEMGRKAVGGDVGAGLDHCEGQLSGNDDLNMKDDYHTIEFTISSSSHRTMKLRLRSLETKETLKIEVPTQCSLQHLKEAVSLRVSSSSSSSSPVSVHLSLNRKDGLVGSSPHESRLSPISRKVFKKEVGEGGSGDHKLLVIAVHAVLLESGFVAFDSITKMKVERFYLPDEWPRSEFSVSLWYTLHEIINQGLSEDGVETVFLKFRSLGKYVNVNGFLTRNGSRLSSNGDLWKQKFVEQFGNADGSAGGSHWKEKFAKSWETRKRMKTAASVRLSPLMVGPQIFAPRIIRDPNPLREPRIIGGDYDLGPAFLLGRSVQASPRRNVIPHCNLGILHH